MKGSALLTILLSVLFACDVMSQARIVFQNNPYIVIEDGAYLVIDNPNANAITNPAQGNIVSEDEFNYVKWNIGTQTGSYNVPFTTANNFKVPVEVNITAGGSGGSYPGILFSTYGGLGAAWNSFDNRPSPVVNTLDIATASFNNSPYVIDRYWLMDVEGYASKPSATLSIGYADEEHEAPDNSITEANLGAQRYNSDADLWGDYLPQGTANILTNIVSGIPAPAANFYKVWTLVSNEMPLPVELIELEANCENGSTKISWSTASEHNNDYFLIERSATGEHWTALTTVPGNGNSSVKINYNAIDPYPLSSTTYYRIHQFDYNGDSRVYGPVASNCDGMDLEIVNVLNNYNSQQLLLDVSSSFNSDFDLYVMDAAGRVLIARQDVSIKNGMNQVQIDKNNMSMGIYIIQLVNDEHMLTRKVALN